MRILIVTSRFPLPPWRGNQIRTVQWLEALDGHATTLICPEPDDPGGCADLASRGVGVRTYSLHPLRRLAPVARAAFGGGPLQEGLYAVSGARRAVLTELESAPADLVVVQMVRCGWAVEGVRSGYPAVPVLLDAIDSMALHFERAAVHVPAALRPLFRLEARRCRRRERRLAAAADVTVAVARRDLDRLCPEGCRALLVPVASHPLDRAAGGTGRPTILLSGNLGYRPTVTAACWFAREVWPSLAARVPRLRWVLAGARPAARVRRLAAISGIEVHGDVADLRSFLESATVAIAPMASGSGVPMKVLEAWAAGVPVVADRWTAGGLEETDEPGVAVADGPAAWVEHLERLLTDRSAAAALARRGRAVWETTYSPDTVRRAIRNAVEVATQESPGRR